MEKESYEMNQYRFYSAKLVESYAKKREAQRNNDEKRLIDSLDEISKYSEICAIILQNMKVNGKIGVKEINDCVSIEVTDSMDTINQFGDDSRYNGCDKDNLAKNSNSYSTNNGKLVVYMGGRAFLMPYTKDMITFLEQEGFADQGSNLYVPFSNGSEPRDASLAAKLEVLESFTHKERDYLQWESNQETIDKNKGGKSLA